MSAPTGFVYHPDCEDHLTGPGHPETPDRILSIRGELERSSLWRDLDLFTPPEARPEDILRVHDERYVARVHEICGRTPSYIDTGDTPVSSGSLHAAKLAAGGALEAARRVHDGRWKNAFTCLRPPGHHAEVRTGMGFCLFNNAAIAARALVEELGCERVAILDWDVHHGNGTQHAFEADPRVFFASLHQYPLYPGTGAATERGTGDGEGATLNCPMPAGAGDADWIGKLERDVLPEIERFRPDFLLVSAGFDAHREDPLAGTNLTEAGFTEMTRLALALARTCCDGRLLALLEGGYDLRALAASAHAHIAELHSA